MINEKVSRRTFIQLGGGLGLAAATGWGCNSAPAPVETASKAAEAAGSEWGVELYTVRDLLPQEPEATLKAIAEMGYRQVEISSSDLERLMPIVRDLGLEAPAGHFPSPLITGNWEGWKPMIGEKPADASWEGAVEEATRYGLKAMVIAYLLPAERGDADYFRRFADQMNQAGEVCQKAGIRLGYHNHAFEFEPRDGGSIFEILMGSFNPELVGFELDVFWSSVAGVDPVGIFQKYPGRIPLVHLKDVPADAPHGYSEQVPPEIFKEVGSGSLDFPAILAAARECGAQHFFVEQDQCPGSPLDSLKSSLQYLNGLK